MKLNWCVDLWFSGFFHIDLSKFICMYFKEDFLENNCSLALKWGPFWETTHFHALKTWQNWVEQRCENLSISIFTKFSIFWPYLLSVLFVKEGVKKHLFKIVMPLEGARRRLSERDLMDEMEVASRNFYHFLRKIKDKIWKKNFFFTLMGRNRITFFSEMLLFL